MRRFEADTYIEKPEKNVRSRVSEVIDSCDFARRVEEGRERLARLTDGFPKASVLQAHADPFGTAIEVEAYA